MRRILLKRLPLLVFAALGLWLWQGGSGFFASPRRLSWRFSGDYASIRRAEVQLWDEETLLGRQQLWYPEGVNLEPTQSLALKAGAYSAKVLVWRADAGEPEVRSLRVVVGDEPALTVGP